MVFFRLIGVLLGKFFSTAGAPNLREFVLNYRHLDSRRVSRWFRSARRVPDPDDLRDLGRRSNLLESESPIEVEHVDPQKPLYCRTFQKSDVQKHNVFDTFLSVRVQKHKENITFSKNVSKTLRKTSFLKPTGNPDPKKHQKA